MDTLVDFLRKELNKSYSPSQTSSTTHNTTPSPSLASNPSHNNTTTNHTSSNNFTTPTNSKFNHFNNNNNNVTNHYNNTLSLTIESLQSHPPPQGGGGALREGAFSFEAPMAKAGIPSFGSPSTSHFSTSSVFPSPTTVFPFNPHSILPFSFSCPIILLSIKNRCDSYHSPNYSHNKSITHCIHNKEIT